MTDRRTAGRPSSAPWAHFLFDIRVRDRHYFTEMNDPAPKDVDKQLFKNAPAKLQARLKVVRKELRAKARRQWRDNNLQEQPPRSTHEGSPER